MTMPKLPKLPQLPEVTFNRSGYEIRADILALAKDAVQVEYSSKFAGWELTAKKDYEGQLVTSVTMPQVPGIEQILVAAEQMYKFVNSTNPRN